MDQTTNWKLPKINPLSILIHGVCWSLFIALELGFLYTATHRLDRWYSYFSYYSLNIAFFYCHAVLLIFTFNYGRISLVRASVTLSLLFLSYLFIKSCIDVLYTPKAFVLSEKLRYARGYLIPNTYRCLYFLLLSTFYWAAGYLSFFRRKAMASERTELIAQKDKAELETRLAASRNAYLQQQINPHFLFNSLNFIYTSVYPHSPTAARMVWLLSEVMRYSLEGISPDGKVDLASEVEQLGHLTEINQIRFDQALYFEMNFGGNMSGLKIIPLILMTLTENIFKHGQLGNPDEPAFLNLNVNEQQCLTYNSRNRKKPTSKFERASQIGLSNMILRLEEAYSGNYEFRIVQDKYYFETHLTISL